MFLIKLLLIVNLQSERPIRVVYSYDRWKYDSLEIIVNRNEKTIHHKNHKSRYEIDSIMVGYGKKTDVIEVIMRAYKKDLYCYPFIDKMVYPHYRMSYGLNFECVKFKA
jgi:hypothetical protein